MMITKTRQITYISIAWFSLAFTSFLCLSCLFSRFLLSSVTFSPPFWFFFVFFGPFVYPLFFLVSPLMFSFLSVLLVSLLAFSSLLCLYSLSFISSFLFLFRGFSGTFVIISFSFLLWFSRPFPFFSLPPPALFSRLSFGCFVSSLSLSFLLVSSRILSSLSSSPFLPLGYLSLF